MSDINMCRVVHDLKLPVCNVTDAVDIVKTLTDNPDVLKMMDLIEQSCSYMKRSIGTLFDLVQIKDYEVHVKYSARSIRDFVNEYVLWIAPVLESKSVSLEYNVKGKEDNFVCDYDLLIKVLNNLIGNAIKYNDKAEKTIGLVVKSNENGFEFCVSDNGIGIPANEIDLVTSCHYRATNANKVTSEGNGLGLNLVAEIIGKLNGRLEIKSKVGTGSKFKITLPQGTVTTLRSDSAEVMIMKNTVLEEFFL